MPRGLLTSLLLGLALCTGVSAWAATDIAVAELPEEARTTLQLIKQGGPFPYDKDGAVFGNFEKRLPLRPRGYYREYTVETPGVSHRGKRRIVAGAGPSQAKHDDEYYYTADHYQSFRRIRE